MKVVATLREFEDIARRCEDNFRRQNNEKTRKKHEVLDFSAPCFGCVLFKGCFGRKRPSLAELFEIIPEPEDEEDYDGEDDD